MVSAVWTVQGCTDPFSVYDITDVNRRTADWQAAEQFAVKGLAQSGGHTVGFLFFSYFPVN